jgi:hypothetical protein
LKEDVQVALTVLVRTYTGEVISTSTHRAIGSLCELAQERGLSLLGNIDKYDDTVFNRQQVARIRVELDELRGFGGDEKDEAIGEIAHLVDIVVEKPHRYLFFNGD